MDRGAGVPADASALIYLAKADGFELVHRVFPRIDLPPAVWREAVEEGREKRAEVPRIVRAEEVGWLHRIPLAPAEARAAGELAVTERLGGGESEVIAITPKGRACVIDELRGARVARRRGSHVTPTLTIPVLALERGVATEEEAIALLRAVAIAANALADVVDALERKIREVR